MYLAIALGGAIGAAGRHLVGGQVLRLMGDGFPFGTLLVNVVGSFLMGALIEILALRWSAGPEVRAFLTVGMMGGFTTFSAFSMETFLLYERGGYALAGLYVVASVTLSVAALIGGLLLFRQILA